MIIPICMSIKTKDQIFLKPHFVTASLESKVKARQEVVFPFWSLQKPWTTFSIFKTLETKNKSQSLQSNLWSDTKSKVSQRTWKCKVKRTKLLQWILARKNGTIFQSNHKLIKFFFKKTKQQTRLKVSIYRARQNCMLTKSKGWAKIWTELKIGQNWKLEQIENRTKLKTGKI